MHPSLSLGVVVLRVHESTTQLNEQFCELTGADGSPNEKVNELPGPDLEGGGYGWSEKAGLELSEPRLVRAVFLIMKLPISHRCLIASSPRL